MADAKTKRARVWEIQTQLYDMWGNPRIDLDALKQKLIDLRQSGDIIDYALCVHNKDYYTQEDADRASEEIAGGSKRRPIKAGELKPEHVHIPLRLKDPKTMSALTKLVGTGITETMIVNVRRNASGSEDDTFDDKAAYLCHERQPDKAQYSYDEIWCSFDYKELMERYSKRMIRKGRGKQSRAFRDDCVNKIAAGEMSINDLIHDYGYAVYEADKRHYDNAESYYLRTHYQGEGFRLTVLITGGSTVGKTPLAKILACSMFKEIENPRQVYYSVGDEGAGLQGYNGQPVIIWDDFRAMDFLASFNRNVLFNSLFSVHPDPVDFNIKYGSVVLRHTVNIVTCIDDIDTFTRELAGEYTDKNGNIHKSEEKQVLQMYKRIWGLSEVTEDEIVFMVNKGYYNPDPALYKQYEACLRIQNNTRSLAERYSPMLYGKIGMQLMPEVQQKYQEQADKELGKITDPNMIDPADLPLRLPLISGGDDNNG